MNVDFPDLFSVNACTLDDFADEVSGIYTVILSEVDEEADSAVLYILEYEIADLRFSEIFTDLESGDVSELFLEKSEHDAFSASEEGEPFFHRLEQRLVLGQVFGQGEVENLLNFFLLIH